MNLTDIQLNFTNLPIEPSSPDICELNEYIFLEHVQKYPKIAFFFLLAAFLFLILEYFVLQRFKWYEPFKGWAAQRAMIPASIALYYMAWTTFNVTEQVYSTVIQPVMVIAILALLAIIVYDNRERLKRIFQKKE